MKLNNKILLSNIVLSVVIIMLTAVGLYFLVNDTVYEELDNHLLQHKIDIMTQLQGNPESLSEIQKLGGLGSYEWIEITPYEDGLPLHTNNYSTIDTVRNADAAQSEAYRRLVSTISVEDQYYTVRIYEEVAAWDDISMTILLSVMGGLMIWILLLYLVNQGVLNRILTPFYDTVDTLERISNPTDFDEVFPSSSTYEIDVLNRALNSMMNEIQSYFEDQKKFIQNASHELLTPLSIIRQKAERILSQADKLDRQTLESVNDIQHTAIRLSRLSNALLMISRVENKQYSLEDAVNIREVTEKVTEELGDFISMKNLELETQFDKDITVQGNRELIHSAIYNIVQNAVKFSPPESSIQVSTNGQPGMNEFSVRDHGPGIPDSFINSVFDRFKKGKNNSAGNGKEDSPGLGLSIVKSICQLHGFTCKARNVDEDGAEISIRF